MNRKILLMMVVLLLPFSIYAQSDYGFKISGGLINAPNIDEEIVLDEDDPGLTFKDYEGEEGYEYKLSVLLKYAEFGYKIQHYTATKEGAYETDKGTLTEKGEIEFDTQTAFAAIYFGDPMDFVGLNMSLGVGTGITKLTINREFKEEPFGMEDGLAYAKEIHYFAGIHYGMSETYGFSLIYAAQTINTVRGSDFTNDFVELTIDFMF
jgi:hypothetical protein